MAENLLRISVFSCSWRFTFYLLAFFAGLAVLIDVSTSELGLNPEKLHYACMWMYNTVYLCAQKPWFFKMEEVWNGFPTLVMLSNINLVQRVDMNQLFCYASYFFFKNPIFSQYSCSHIWVTSITWSGLAHDSFETCVCQLHVLDVFVR